MGPFFTAMVDPDVEFDAVAHAREDLDVFGFSLEHSEGDFAGLELTVRNPRVGLLSPGQKQWIWFSVDRAWQKTGSWVPDVIPLFHGRIVGTPSNLTRELVDLSFLAKPGNFDDLKAIYAETLKVRPYWDPVWFDPDHLTDPDVVLESRAELWNIDPVTLEVTTSSILAGEDGTCPFGESQILYDSVNVTYGETPLARVDMTAQVSWEQTAFGTLNLSQRFSFGAFSTILTYTGKGLVDNWPKSGASLGNGWTVEAGAAVRVDGTAQVTWGYIGPTLAGNHLDTAAFPAPKDINVGEWHKRVFAPEWYDNVIDPFFGNAFSKIVFTPRWRVAPLMVVSYDVSRQYTETLLMTMTADVQPVFSEPGDAQFMSLSMSSSELASPIDEYGQIPIGDVRRRTFFAQDRGAQAIEYLICVMRSHLLARSRCVDVDFQVPLYDAVDAEVTLRKSAVITDRYLPGGVAAGKIKRIVYTLDGDQGTMLATITVGCTVGRGNTVTPTAGTPDYVEDDYVEPDYQIHTGSTIMPIAGEITYTPVLGQSPNDDGLSLLDLRADNCVKSLVKTNPWQLQEVVMGDHAKDPGEVADRANSVPTKFDLVMVPLTGGPFETLYMVELSQLMVPKTIDLEVA